MSIIGGHFTINRSVRCAPENRREPPAAVEAYLRGGLAQTGKERPVTVDEPVTVERQL